MKIIKCKSRIGFGDWYYKNPKYLAESGISIEKAYKILDKKGEIITTNYYYSYCNLEEAQKYINSKLEILGSEIKSYQELKKMFLPKICEGRVAG